MITPGLVERSQTELLNGLILSSKILRFLHCDVLRIRFRMLFYVFTLSSDSSSAAIAVSFAMHVHHCQLPIFLRDCANFCESEILNIAYHSETELASASAVCDKREEAIDDRPCNGSYKSVCLGAFSGLHMTERLFCILSKVLFALCQAVFFFTSSVLVVHYLIAQP